MKKFFLFQNFLPPFFAKSIFIVYFNSKLFLIRRRNSLFLDINYLTFRSLSYETKPFPHIIIDNFLSKNAYLALEDFLQKTIKKGLSNIPNFDTFFPFNLVYRNQNVEGNMLGIKDENTFSYFNFITSQDWINFIGTVTNFPLTHVTSTAVHHHNPSDHTWPAHTDDEYLSFDTSAYSKHGVTVHVPGQNNTTSFKRALATIFYVNNYFDMKHDGGGTLFYDTHVKAVKRVAPCNNRLLIFPVSPDSLHGFEGNKHERMTLVQWFYYKR